MSFWIEAVAAVTLYKVEEQKDSQPAVASQGKEFDDWTRELVLPQLPHATRLHISSGRKSRSQPTLVFRERGANIALDATSDFASGDALPFPTRGAHGAVLLCLKNPYEKPYT